MAPVYGKKTNDSINRMDSEWIKDLNVERRTIKLIGNVEEALLRDREGLLRDSKAYTG